MMDKPAFLYLLTVAVSLTGSMFVHAATPTVALTSDVMTVTVDVKTGAWAMRDMRSGVQWPSEGMASAGSAKALADGFSTYDITIGEEGKPVRIDLIMKNGPRVSLILVDGGQSLEIGYAGEALGDVRLFEDALAITDTEGGYAVVPCREGLLFRADSGRSFKRTFGTSDYEGCHMNMLGFVKRKSALILDWDDAYVFPELQSILPQTGPVKQRLTTSVSLRRSARTIRVTPLGKGDWNTIATGYRRIAERKKLAVTMAAKTRREPHAALLSGAANVKLWTCLARRMNEDSTAEESVKVRWTFDEAARIAEHLHNDLAIEKCLFVIGGWTEGGYDCRHPDALPANGECGGNDALADAVRRIQNLGYVAAFHDNYQDMYADAKSWDPAMLEKDTDGNIRKGGRWLGGRAYMVCAPKQLELAQRPQNLPEIERLFDPWCYFIDTTFAVGPRECYDPNHPIGRNEDIMWKQKLSDFSRDTFGLFGSECGREWALPHSDWFEGLVGVSGHYFHNLEPEKLGAVVIPFWEMVYHDCQVCHGKYGYNAREAAEYVVHHALCARTLNYHSMPDHLYWQDASETLKNVPFRPAVAEFSPAGPRSFDITYEWEAEGTTGRDWRVFVHFMDGKKIVFQNDHTPEPPTSTWKAGQRVRIGPFRVDVPEKLTADNVIACIGLFGPDVSERAPLVDADGQHRIQLGTLTLKPELVFTPGGPEPDMSRACFARCDQGWADGLHPTDVFIKNTQEFLGPLNAATTNLRLTDLEFLNPDGSLKRAVYGTGSGKVTVTVNTGSSDVSVTSTLGGDVVLPRWGVLVEAPCFTAFHAKRWGGLDYPDAALFTVRSEDDKPISDARKLRIFHAFGKPVLSWRGKMLDVPRENVIELD